MLFLFSCFSIYAQGVYNNGAQITISSGTFLNISGNSGRLLNETNVTDGVLKLDGTLKLEGNYINNVVGADVIISAGPSGEVIFNGATQQQIVSNSTAPCGFENLTIDNPSGVLLLQNATVNGVFKLTNGLFEIGNSTLDLGLNATFNGTPSASAMIVATGLGELRKKFSGNGTFTFPVGDNSGTPEYSPISLNFTSGIFDPGAHVGVNLANSAYNDPMITGSYLNRYWNINQTGISGFSCNAIFSYNISDIIGQENNLSCARMNPLPITMFDPANTGLHQLTATSLTSFGSFTGAMFNGIKNLNLTLFLEGLYNGGSIMRKAQGDLGDEFLGNIADKITIELHDPVTYSNIVYSVGNIDLTTSGLAIAQIPGIYSNSYYVTVLHRNSIATVSASPLSFSTNTVNYDFTSALSQAFGSNLVNLGAGVFGIYGGDANVDGAVDALDILDVQNDVTLFTSGYMVSDINGDGSIDIMDLILVQNNAILFISSYTP